MATYTAIDDHARNTLSGKLARLGLGTLETLVGIPAGSVNSNYRVETASLIPGQPSKKHFLRLYEEQDRAGALAEARLLGHLASRGVQTPAPIPWEPQDAASCVTELAGKPAALFAWIEGHMRCQATVTPEDARAVGAALAHVHLSGQEIIASVGEGRFRVEDLYVRLERVRAAADPELARQADPIEARLRAAAAARARDLPTGLVHGDIFRDNVLWHPDGRISALLDFESASRGVWAYDLAVTILAWTFGHEFDARLVRSLIEGYDRVRTITKTEREAFASECTLAALRFTITRITDYAMRAHEGGAERVQKDWRRFDARAKAIEALAPQLEAQWMPAS